MIRSDRATPCRGLPKCTATSAAEAALRPLSVNSIDRHAVNIYRHHRFALFWPLSVSDH
jgi:hypothetical protein